MIVLLVMGLGVVIVIVGLIYVVHRERNFSVGLSRIKSRRQCHQCDYDLSGGLTEICPECGQTIAPPMCPFCGKLIGAGEHECEKCRKPLPPDLLALMNPTSMKPAGSSDESQD